MEECMSPNSKASGEMPSSDACESEVIVVDSSTPSQAQAPCQPVISLSSSSSDDSDSYNGINDKTWAEAEDDITSDSDCTIIDSEQTRAKAAKKSRYREQKRDYKGKFTSENPKQNSFILNIPRRNPKREAATVNFKRYQLSPCTTFSRTGVAEELQLSRPVSPRAPSAASAPHKKFNVNRSHEPPKKKSKVPGCHHQNVVNTRSVTRRLGSEGCVLEPPTPEDALELREWPAEGMHERPVWPDPRYEIPEPPTSELEISVHNSLHSVLAFAAQLGRSTRGNISSINTSTESKRDITCKMQEVEGIENTELVMNLRDSKRLEHNTLLLTNLSIEDSSKVQIYCNHSESHERHTSESKRRPQRSDSLRRIVCEENYEQSLVTRPITCSRGDQTDDIPAYGTFSESLGVDKCTSITEKILEHTSTSGKTVGVDRWFGNRADAATGDTREVEASNLAMLNDELSYKLATVSIHNSATFSDDKAELINTCSYIPESQKKKALTVHNNTLIEKNQLHDLESLMLDTGILYCAVCSVSQKALAEYIDSMSVESALNWLQEVK